MENALKEISKTLSETILIVGLVVFLFMGSLRTAIVPLVAMPVSLIGATLVIYLMGFSLNLLTLLAIVLAVGLVVDDAIVVVENVQRHILEGHTRIDAALLGARELVGPIIAIDLVQKAYGGILGQVLGLRWAIAFLTVLVAFAAVPLYLMSPKELAPVEDQGAIAVALSAAPDATLKSSTKWATQLAEGFQTLDETEYMWALINPGGGFGGVMTKDWHLRERSTSDTYGDVFKIAMRNPGLRSFPVLVPPLPGAGQFDVEWCSRATSPLNVCSRLRIKLSIELEQLICLCLSIAI